MRLIVVLPAETFLDLDVDQVVAEAEDGHFGIEPRHIDFVTALVPGILGYVKDGEETFMAVDEGILVKNGPEVRVSVRNATRGARLGELMRTVEEKFQVMDDKEKNARSAAAKIEADLVRGFMEIGRNA
jgi:F-type H+-transporting ATPase subunit epsilon